MISTWISQESYWNCWQIRDGFLRLNELTGVLQMSKGKMPPGEGDVKDEGRVPNQKGGSKWLVSQFQD